MRQAALVTGGAVRLGRHLALALAARGYDIALHYNSSVGAAETTKREIEGCGVECQIFSADLSGPAGIETELIEKVCALLPGLNTLVNSASIYEPGTLQSLTHAQIRSQFRVNTEAPILLTQAFANIVKKGQVINILDNKIAFAQYEYTAYLLSKKTLAEFTKLAALELAPHIRVNGLAPGVVLPAESRTSEYLDYRVQGIPLKRQGRADEVAAALGYLCDNEFVTGQILFVDGGESLGPSGRNAPAYEGRKG